MMTIHDDVKKEITKVLKDALSGLPEAAQLDKIGEVLQSAEATVGELIQKLTNKEEELAKSGDENKALQKQVEDILAKTKELEEQIASQEAELKSLEEKLASAEQRAFAAETVVNAAEAARVLDARVAELAEAKVLKSGEKLEAQKSKIGAMTDEEFASYRDELVELRAELAASLAETTTEVAAEVADETNVETEEVVEVAPPAIKKEEAAAAGALDVETVETPTLKKKYLEFAHSLAKLMDNK
jgi:septal ring factor EnvC (AmiA/AmiB activator)